MSSYSRPIRFVLLCLFLLLPAGCAGLRGYSQTPKVSVADIQVAETKTLETAFLVQLRVINPNDKSLDVQGVDCSLEVDGRKFADGISGEGVLVPAYGSALVPVTVYSSMFDMVGSFIGFIRNRQEAASSGKPVGYRLTGNLRLNRDGFLGRIPFKSSGEFSLGGLSRGR